MAENNRPNSISWQIPEYEVKERNRNWYILAVLFLLTCLFFCFFQIVGWKVVFLGASSNFIFALILIMAAILFVMTDGRDPNWLEFTLGPTGITIGPRFYDYDIIKSFSVLYKPSEDLKHVYLEFKNSLTKPRLSINLYDEDPVEVRNYLLRHLNEDLERVAPPLSEQLTRLLKL